MSEPVTEVEYLHRFEYRSRNKDGTWTDVEIRYHNRTVSEDWVRRRHLECKDVEFIWDKEFEGIWGYSYKNCVLVRRETVTFVAETELDPSFGK